VILEAMGGGEDEDTRIGNRRHMEGQLGIGVDVTNGIQDF